jgi:polysaccharide export outer membrane protein
VIRVLARVLALALLLAPPPLAAQNGAPANDGVLQPGDQIRIAVWRNVELSGELAVGADGTLVHPLYRAVRVTGIPLDAVQARIRAFLEQYEARPQFVVEPLVRVAVSGEVARPHLYYMRPDVTVAQAVALAGGATERGRRDRVRWMRAGAVRVVHLGGADPAGGLPVRSGDQLVVERRRAVFREVVTPIIAVAGAAAAIAGVVMREGQ